MKDENYLAHHGIKGQKWGVRKEEDKKSPKKKLSKEELLKRKEKGKKIVKGIAIGTASVAATAAATALVVKGQDMLAMLGMGGLVYAMSVLSN